MFNGIIPDMDRSSPLSIIPGSPKRVAVMQPYFFPYAGYFRLFGSADEFVIYDCVQFPRRGRVHRTEVPGPDGSAEWLTLPLAHQARATLIRELEFATGARREFDKRLGRLPWLRNPQSESGNRVRELLFGPLDSVIDFLEDSLRLVLQVIGIEPRITRSSILDVDPALRGQDRVIAIVKAVGGTEYLNSPGGRGLYSSQEFAAHGIRLLFLSDYSGPYFHLLHALVSSPAENLRRNIMRDTNFVDDDA